MNALVVSGSERARAWIRSALGPAWVVDESVNGVEAVRRCQKDDYDLVVADETTEPFGAFGLARELKILPEPPSVIVLLERTQDTWLAKWSGVDAWLNQPIDPFAVARTANELMQERASSGPQDRGLGREDIAVRETDESRTAGVERYPR